MKLLYSVILASLFLTNCLFAQYYDGEHYSPTIVDTRSFSMGNTQILSATGSNALFSNPGILSTSNKIQAQAGGRAYWGSYSSDLTEGLETGYSFYPKFTNISFAIPINFENSNFGLALSGGYHTFLDWSWEYTEESDDSDHKLKRSGGIDVITLGISANFLKNYNIGISYSTSVSVKVETEQESNYTYDSETSTSEYKYKNVSFVTIGAFANPTEKLNIGLFLRTDFDIDGDTYSLQYSHGYNESGSNNIHIAVPVYWGIGLGYEITPNLVVNAEYQNRPYSDIETSFNDFSNYIENGQCLRIGVETFAGKFPIRFGFFLDDIFEINESGKKTPVSLLGITAGTGYMFTENLGVDIGFQYNHYSNDLESYGADGSGEANINLMRISAGINYFFD